MGLWERHLSHPVKLHRITPKADLPFTAAFMSLGLRVADIKVIPLPPAS